MSQSLSGQSLSGKYFNLVLGWYPGLIKVPLVLHIGTDGVKVKGEPLGFKLKGPAQILRVILESDQSRHSNVLVIDHILKRVIRFDPSGDTDSRVHEALLGILRPSFKGYDFIESPSHPQQKNDNLCVAYTIRFARDYIMRNGDVSGGNSDILELVKSVKTLYQLPLEEEMKDLEHGPGGFGLGLVGGLAIGGLAGAAIASPRPYYYYPYPAPVAYPRPIYYY